MRDILRDRERLQHTLAAIADILEFTQGKSFADFCADKMLRHAVYRNFALIGEAANLLSKEFRAANPAVPWTKIIAMRHILIHGYYAASERIVWLTIERDLPPLQASIATLAAIAE